MADISESKIPRAIATPLWLWSCYQGSRELNFEIIVDIITLRMAGSCTARWCSSTSRGRPGIAHWRRKQGPTGLEPGHDEYGNDVDFVILASKLTVMMIRREATGLVGC